MDEHKNNIDPRTWGKCAWDFLKYIALSYPSNPCHDTKLNYKAFFQLLGDVLPCESCQENYKNKLHDIPIDGYLESPSSLLEWLNIIEEDIKERNKERYKERNMITQQQYTCSYSFLISLLSLIILIIIITAMIICRRQKKVILKVKDMKYNN